MIEALATEFGGGTLPQAREEMKVIRTLLHRMSNEEQSQFVNYKIMPQDKWLLLDEVRGGPTDTFEVKRTYAVGLCNSTDLSILTDRDVKLHLINNSTHSINKTFTKMKPLAGQLAALDVLRGQMLSALSFLGCSAEGNRA